MQFYGELEILSHVFCLFTFFFQTSGGVRVRLLLVAIHCTTCTGKWHSSSFKGYMLRCLRINIALNIGICSETSKSNKV